MSYRGRPSKGCETCRTRKVKCDEAKPTCNRCSKLGHECKYRDPADIMFRNQTSFAAQKAEGSWRKRAKSNQRNGSDCSESPNSTFDEQQVPQDVQTSQPNNISPGIAPIDQQVPTLNFNELSIVPRVWDDLRRLAYERLLYDFVIFASPKGSSSDESPDSLWEFIPALYQRSLDGSCLATIVDAVAYCNFANRCKSPEAQKLAGACMGKGIMLLQEAIADKEKAVLDETLCSVYLMGVYETLNTPVLDGGYRTHSEGASALLRLRPPEILFSNPISASLYDSSCVQQLIRSLQTATHPQIPIEGITAAKAKLPKLYSTASIRVMELLYQEASLHAKWREIKKSLVPPSSRFDLQQLLQTALELDAEYQAWESGLSRPWRYQMERNTPDARSTYDPLWRNLILGSRGAPEEIHSYTTLRRCGVWGFYRTSRIYLLRDILEILNWMFKLPEPSPPQNTNQLHGDRSNTSQSPNSMALDNVGLQIHHSFATTHLINVIEKMCSAVLGSFTVPIYGKSAHDIVGMRGYTQFWSLGVIDCLLKADLLPDSGAAVGPFIESERSQPTIQSSSQGSPFSLFDDMPDPSPAVFRIPPQYMNTLYSTPPVQAPQINEFPNLPPIEVTRPNPLTTAHNVISTHTLDLPATEPHIWDLSPPHPWDRTIKKPSIGTTITKLASIDVSAKREWINRILCFLGSELGIKKAVSVPAMEGYLPSCKKQVEAILAQS